VTVSVVGYIFPLGTINFSSVEPFKPRNIANIDNKFFQLGTKRKEKYRQVKSQAKAEEGYSCLSDCKFVEACTDILEKMDKKGVYFVMHNYRMYHSYFIVETINKRS
jgi:hypothetical protein